MKGKSNEVFGVGGKATIYFLHKIIIEVGGWPFEIEAGFIPNVSGRTIPHGLVGQRGFFEHFIVGFDFNRARLEIKPSSLKKK